MSNINNTTKVHFAPDQDYIWEIKGLEQWDKCQKLEISGLDISDEIVEVHFSLEEFQGSAKRMLGVVKDGVIYADIPAFVLEGPGYCNGIYLAYAWVYVSDEESAETIRKMEFEIKARPKPEEYVTPDELSFLQQLEQAIKNKITTPSSAKVGQLLQVKKVDENGKPTEFDVVDKSEVGGDIKVDTELSEESKNPVENQVVAKEFAKFGGTVEITSEEPTKEKTVLTLDPSGEEVILYTAEEVDELLENKADKEKTWRLLQSIILEEDTGSVIITEDSDGNGFEISSLMIVVENPVIGGVNANAFIEASPDVNSNMRISSLIGPNCWTDKWGSSYGKAVFLTMDEKFAYSMSYFGANVEPALVEKYNIDAFRKVGFACRGATVADGYTGLIGAGTKISFYGKDV